MSRRDSFEGFTGVGGRVREGGRDAHGVPTLRPEEAARERRRAEEERPEPEGPRWWRAERTDPEDSLAGFPGATVSSAEAERERRPPRRVLPGPGIRGSR